ncbi:MAG: carboxymuconolactone decarboxylase family protein [Verrucomicrobia bacterium]|nr:carboxymuconolactone decarboxylase family protein [Verrucomicrobiota bacterium]
MARVSYVEGTDEPEFGELVEKIRSGRRGSLINVYRLLLHSPPLAGSWYDHLNQVRWGTQLSGRLREIIIIRIGYLNKVDYVLNQHVPALAEAEGLSVAECDALADWRGGGLFSPEECAALAFADAMTRDVTVPDDVFDALRPFFDERRIVELAILIGTYNMQTRVLAALEIDLEPK